MKIPLISILLYFITSLSFSQTITGNVMNAASNEPLEFVSIGVIDKAIGTVTNQKGEFKLELKDVAIENKIRFSMIGYKAQVFSIKELLNKNNLIKLDEEPIQLSEVIVRPTRKLRKVGTTNSPFLGEVCGWGGTEFENGDGFGKGHEIGTELDLGSLQVKLITLHLRLHKQSFDSTLLRLHIRSIVDSLPGKELLSENIIITVSQESGWLDFDLNQYNIVLTNDIALSLEWVKIYGVNKDRLMRMNYSKYYSANILFKVKRKKGSMFVKWGSEAKWKRIDNKSPAFYLTVQE